MTIGFLDSATITNAIFALHAGKSRTWTPWEQTCLLDLTHLLMYDSVRIAPDPGLYRTAFGPQQIIRKAFPLLPEVRSESIRRAETLTKQLMSGHSPYIRGIYDDLQRDPSYDQWLSDHVAGYWPMHTQMHDGLFNREFISQLSGIIGCTEEDLTKVHDQSRNLSVVRAWSKSDAMPGDKQLAMDAFAIAAIVRGRFHQHVSQSESMQLRCHPLRDKIVHAADAAHWTDVYNSEEILAKVCIGSALLERKQSRRIEVWTENVKRVRDAFQGRRAPLPDCATWDDAENEAAHFARRIGIAAEPRIVRDALAVVAAVSVATLLKIGISPWIGGATILASPIAGQAYQRLRGRTISQDIESVLTPNSRYKQLARGVPGRVERQLRPINL